MAGEFDFIARHLRPLAGNASGALNLIDDVAIVPPGEGELVVSTDMVVAGVHVLPTSDARAVGFKALSVNVSDLVAKGAAPFGYLMAIAWPAGFDEAERAALVAGLADAQVAYALDLYGGDTTRSPGPLTISITVFGRAGPRGPALRTGARVGDDLWVSGAIGDGWLGLQARLGDAAAQAVGDGPGAWYDRPHAPIALTRLVADHAHAGIDVSDGLLADVAHIAHASGVAIELDLDSIPLSAAGLAWLGAQGDGLTGMLALSTGGDDYQVAMTAPVSSRGALEAREAVGGAPAFRRIGRVVEGGGLRLVYQGEEIPLPDRVGFTHF